ncbi:D-2-hydroxyacid dehydrogenase [Treponema pectinovorum]|uniref:D-2-hydroxyacid dehydrogenase n=1 Tax=Treponema pectinovorum TaxID=164 RepID=UPI001C072D83|nr:D-2-hydroxyacid dehydrogenase [Treponema pectinovorum]
MKAMIKLTILDGFAANPGDLSWEPFKKFAELTIYDRTPPELTVERIADSDAIFLNKVAITEEILKDCPKLKYIGVLATGYNVVDLEAAKKRGIIVTNIPSYSTDSVAQHVFSLILNFTNQVEQHSISVQNGDWINSKDFCYWLSPLTELKGKTLGIFGFGSIGQKVAKIAHAFDMNVLINVHSKNSFTGNEKSVSVEELFAQSDFLTLHAPMTAETKEIVNEKTLSLMKKTAFIINTARGGLVNESDLKKALDEQKIAGYASDVLLKEPMTKDCSLFKAKNCVLTPHIAWAPREARQRLFNIALENLEAFISGKPINVVN